MKPTFNKVWGIPVLLAVTILFGLLAALLGTGLLVLPVLGCHDLAIGDHCLESIGNAAIV